MKKKLVAALIGVFALGFAGLAHAEVTCNKDSKICHTAECPAAKMIKADNIVKFASMDEAAKSGYTACKKCLLAKKAMAVKPAFVGNKGSMMYHKASCPMVAMIKGDNLVNFATKEEAEKAGYKPCAKCFPAEKKSGMKLNLKASASSKS